MFRHILRHLYVAHCAFYLLWLFRHGLQLIFCTSPPLGSSATSQTATIVGCHFRYTVMHETRVRPQKHTHSHRTALCCSICLHSPPPPQAQSIFVLWMINIAIAANLCEQNSSTRHSYTRSTPSDTRTMSFLYYYKQMACNIFSRWIETIRITMEKKEKKI